MDSTTKSFDLSKIGNGQLMTLTYRNGQKRNGLIQQVTSDTITYTYFDMQVGEQQTALVTLDQVNNQTVTIVIADHLDEATLKHSKQAFDGEVKVSGFVPDSQEEKVSFFDTLKTIKDIETLAKAFRNEDSQTLAVIAHYLSPRSRAKFMYLLPEQILDRVEIHLKEVVNIKDDMLTKLERHLSETLQQFKSQKNRTEEPKEAPKHAEPKRQQTPNNNPFDALGGGLGSLLGGINPNDILKNFNPDDLKKILGQQKNAGNHNQDQVGDMFENLMKDVPKIITDLLTGLNPKDDDDDQPRKPKF